MNQSLNAAACSSADTRTDAVGRLATRLETRFASPPAGVSRATWSDACFDVAYRHHDPADTFEIDPAGIFDQLTKSLNEPPEQVSWPKAD